jgi:putative transposase
MDIMSFQIGAEWHFNSRLWRIAERLPIDSLRLVSDENGENIVVPRLELLSQGKSAAAEVCDTAGETQESAPDACSVLLLQEADKEDREIALKRLEKLKQVFGEDILGGKAQIRPEEISSRVGVSKSLIYVWRDWYRQRGVVGLLPKERSDKGAQELSDGTEVIIERGIRSFHMVRSRPSISQTHRHVCDLLVQEKYGEVSLSTIRRRIKQIEAQDKRAFLVAREGAVKANSVLGSVGGEFADLCAPLQIVEIDHTKLDVIVIDEEDLKPIGRPWVTIAMDCKTRAILGWVVSLDCPNSMTVASCLWRTMHRIDVRETFGTKNDHVTFGIPTEIHVDNAKELSCEHIISICAGLGITINKRPPGAPQYGGSIERILGSMTHDLIHQLPGTTRSNPRDKGDYDSEGAASLTLQDVERLVAQWVVDLYQRRRHSAMKTSPVDAWCDAIDRLKLAPRVLDDTEANRYAFLRSKNRKVQRHCVELFGMQFWSKGLCHLIGSTVEFRYDPRDITVVYFEETPGRIGAVPIKAGQGIPDGTSIWELDHLKRRRSATGTGLTAAQQGDIQRRINNEVVSKARENKRRRRQREQAREHQQKTALIRPAEREKSSSLSDDRRALETESWEFEAPEAPAECSRRMTRTRESSVSGPAEAWAEPEFTVYDIKKIGG